MPKYLLFGHTSSGTSTTANCLYNKSSSIQLLNEPFQTLYSDLQQKDKCFSGTNPDGDVIIDARGLVFNDEEKNQSIFASVKEKLKENLSLDCIIFVCKAGMFIDGIDTMLEKVQKEFNQDEKIKTTVLVITDCPKKDWAQKENQQKNKYLQDVLKLCDQKFVELKLDFEQEDDPEDDKIFYQKKREKEISTFLVKMKSFCSTNSNSITNDISMAASIERFAKKQITQNSNNGIKLGHFLKQENQIKINEFDEELIDLSIWKDHIR
jgi:hypothetical protein